MYARNALVVALAGTVLVALSACNGTSSAGPTNSSSMNQLPASSPTQESSGLQPGNEPIAGGVAIPAGGEVKDSRGTYQPLRVAEDAMALRYTSNKVDSGAKELFSKAEIQAAQGFAVKFIVTQSIDSRAYDVPAGWAAWKARNGLRYVAHGQKSILDATDGQGYPALIVTDKNDINPVAIRDGRPRQSRVELEVSKISGYRYEGQPYISVSGVASATYRTTNKELVRSILVGNPDKTKAQLKAIRPDLFNGQYKGGFPVVLDFALALQRQSDGTYRIAGYKNSYRNTLFD